MRRFRLALLCSSFAAAALLGTFAVRSLSSRTPAPGKSEMAPTKQAPAVPPPAKVAKVSEFDAVRVAQDAAGQPFDGGPRTMMDNRRKGLRTWFDAAGIKIEARTKPTWSLTLKTKEVGRPGAMQPVSDVPPVIEGADVIYVHPWGRESYVNGTSGIEQIYMIPARPSGDGPLEVHIAANGLTASTMGDSIVFSSKIGLVRYGHLAVSDAAGRPVPAHMEWRNGEIALVVNDAQAAYPITIDPTLSPTLDLDPGSDTGSSSSDDITADNTPTFSGTAVEPSTVEVFDGATSLGTTPTDGSGGWTFTTLALSDGPHTISAVADDGTNGPSAPTNLLVTIDTTPPAAPGTPDMTAGTDLGSSPTDNITKNNTPTFDGTTVDEADDIIVTLYSGATPNANLTVSGTSWTITASPALLDGTQTITATATDVAGNESAASTGLSVTIDTVAPAVPSTPDMTAGTDTGSSSADDITKNNTPTFDGTADAGTTVTLFSDASPAGSGTAGGGSWSISASTLSDGSHSITATSTDTAGNESSASLGLTVTIDTGIPEPPSTPDLNAASDTGSSSVDNITANNTPTFDGFAEAGTTVALFSDGSPVGSGISGGGAWSIAASTLSDGTHSITATSTDTAGNVSPASSALSVTIDTSAAAPGTPDLTAGSDSGSSSTDNITSDNTPTFTGTAEANASVALTSSLDGPIGSAFANGSGNWSITSSTLTENVHSITAVQTDVAGNVSVASSGLSVTIDITAPAVPPAPDLNAASDTGTSTTDNYTNDTTPTFDGTAEANSTVTLYSDAVLVGTTTATGGAWTITSSALAAGVHSITVRATDAAGNQSTDSSALSITIDTSAAAPSVPDMTAGTDTGSSNSDNITNNNTPTFTGTSEANASVTLLEGVTSLGSTTADGTGNWSITSSALSDGVHSITATQTDLAGNVSVASGALSVTIDTAAAAPSTPDMTAGTDSGSSNSDNNTNDNTPTFTGTAEANASVTLLEGVTVLGSVTATVGGTWTITSSSLSDGIHSITATQTDVAGNTSVASGALSTTIDTAAPAAPPTPDLNAASDSGASNSDDITSNTVLQLDGTAEANSTVQILDGVSVLGTTPANGAGNWSFTTGTLSAGVHSFTVRATDAAGNQSTASGALSVTIDTSAPAAPSTPDLNAANDSGPSPTDNYTNNTVLQLDGTAEANSTVELFDGVTSLGTTTASAGGLWSFTTGTLSSGAHSFTATAKDAAGNTSVASGALSVTIDTTVVAPSTPDMTAATDMGSSNSDNITNDNTPDFSGTSEANAAVTLLEGVTVLGSTTANGSGNWTITSSALSDGVHSITATQTDLAGNASGASGALSVTIDTATATPAAPDLATASDSGTSNTDDITNINTPTINGTGAEVGSSVQLFDGATPIGSPGTANGSGNWSVIAPVLADGVHVLTCVATDTAGNVSATSASLSITIDTSIATPAAPDLNAASDSGVSNSDNITSDTTPTFDGTAEAGSTVTLFSDAVNVGSTTAAGGVWSITASVLADGVHAITVQASDAAGNTSAVSASLSVTIDSGISAPSVPDLAAASDSGASSTDDLTNDNTPTFNGTAEANCTVTLYEGVTSLGSTTANGAGAWSITTGALSDGVHNVFATASDTAGNSASSVTLPVTIDTAAPAAPSTPDLAAASDSGISSTDNITSDSTPTLDGTAEALSTVQIFDGVTSLGTTTVSGIGNWTFTTGVLADGVHSFTAVATDVAGNVGVASGALAVTIDTSIAAPSTPDLAAASDSGSSNTDNNTNDTTPTFNGTAEANSTVTIFDSVTSLGSTTADGLGNWSFTTGALADGGHSMTAVASDAAGNVSSASAALVVTIDTAPPGAPSTPDLNAASDSGTSSTDNITNDTTPTLDGTSEANAIVEIFDGVTSLGTTNASGAGIWSFTTGALSTGAHSLTAKATDAAGNTGVAIGALSLTIDTAAPAAPSTPNLNAASDTGTSSTDDLTNDTTPTLDGTSEANAIVEIFDGVTSLGTTTADGSGNWTFTSAVLAAGVHSFTATAKDAAGNTGVASAALSVTIDTAAAAPSTPDIDVASDSGTSNSDDYTNDTTPTLNGTSEANASVDVFENAVLLGTTTANGSGNWTFTTAALPAGVKSFTARQTDTAGNVSPVSGALAVTIDVTAAAPGVPDLDVASDTGTSSTDNLTNDNTPTLSGSGADAGATVQLFSSTTLIASTTADGSGNWTITTPVIGDGSHDFNAKQIDLAGNTSAPSPNLPVVVDTVAPLTPAAPNLQAASDLGTSNSDNITSDNTPTFDGTAEISSTVTLYDGVTSVGTIAADLSGNWTITSSLLADGVHTMTVKATDAAGNVSASSLSLSVTIDTSIATPSVPDLDTASDSGTSTTDNLTNDNTPTFSGTSEANATVTLFEGVTLLGTTTASGLGAWSITSSVLSDGVHNVFATATDAAGNSASSATLAVTIDTAAPAAPSTPDLNAASDTGVSSTDNITADNTPTFDGTAEAGSTVTVISSLAGTLGTTVAGGGNWSFTSGLLADGVHNITATSTDAAGNVSAASSALPVTIDASIPSAPSTPDLIDASDSGTSSSDNLTSDNTPTFSGAADPNVTIELFDGVTSLGTTTSDGAGLWSFTTATLADGVHPIKGQAKDGSGNASPFSATLSVTIDTAAPAAPGTPDLAAASDTGSSNTDDITTDTTPTLNGTSEANAIVQVFDGVTSLGTTTADGSGNWSFTPAALSAGVHSFTATAKDVAGNTGVASAALSVTIDTSIASPSAPDLNAASDSGISNSDNFTQDTTPTLDGTAEANSSVQIFDGVTSLGTVTANGAGAWTFTTAALPDGAHSFTVVATDLAGNVSTASAALVVTIDNAALAPAAPDLDAASDTGTSNTDNLTNDNTPTLSGTGAEAGATVQLFSGTTPLLPTTTADGSGNWTITLATIGEGSHDFNVKQTDLAGNVSGPSANLPAVVDTVAPLTPATPNLQAASDTGSSSTDDVTSDNTPTLDGTAEASSIVEIFDGLASLGTTTATVGGAWTFTTGTLTDGVHSITVTAKDAAGNTSTASTALSITIDTAIATPSVPDLDAASDSGTSSTDNLTNDNTPTFSGTSEANATVTLFEGVTSLGTTTASGLGAWSITSSVLADGVHAVFATATDAAGNSASSATLAVTIDTGVPAAPSTPDLNAASDSGTSNTDNLTNDTTPTFDGTAEAASTVTISSSIAGTLGTTVAAGGVWSFTSGLLADGVHNITATATDAAGNVSAASSALPVTIDATVPSAPSTPDLIDASDSGTSSSDNLTNDNTPTFSGAADPNVTIELFDGVTSLGTTTSDGSGNWSFTAGTLADGVHLIKGRASDGSGNTSPYSATLSVTIDTAAPAAPGTPDLAAGSDTGSSSTDDITNDTTPTLNGTAEANADVEVFDGATSLGTTTADGSGNWTFTTAALSAGVHSFTATAEDSAGNVGSASTALSVTIDTAVATPAAPDLDAASDTGISNTDNFTQDTTPTLTGTAEANSSVQILDGATSLGSTLANGGGAWTFTTAALADGAHSFTVVATDLAGNVSAASASLTVNIDNAALAPAAPDLDAASDTGSSSTDNLTNDNTPTLSGTGAEPGATVQLFSGTTPLLPTTTADGSGNWTITLAVIGEGSHDFNVKQTDLAGNVSAPSANLPAVVDTVAPLTPATPNLQAASDTGSSSTDDVTSDNTPTLDGTAEASSTVEMFDGVTSLGTTTATVGGAWTFTTGVLADGTHSLTVTATDAAGNTSTASTALSVTIDTTIAAPSTPDLAAASDSGSSSTDNITSDNTPTFNGTAEATSSVQLFDGVTSLGTTTADGAGNWTLTSGILTDGVHSITAVATDAAGNVSAASAALAITIDTVIATPSTPDLAAASDSGSSSTDDITSDSTPTFNGTAEASSSVQIFDGVTSLGTATADGAGNWTFTSGTLIDGVHSITTVATDPAGNVSVASGALAVTIDTVIATPSTPDLATASDSGSSSTDNITSDDTPTFNGTAEANSTVEIFDGLLSLGTTTADGSGNWTFTSVTLTDGIHSVTAVSTDAAGNVTPASGALAFTIDTAVSPPTTPDLAPASDTGVSNTDNITSDETPTLNGTAEANSSVEVLDGVTSLGTTTADGSGNWTFTPAALADGVYAFNAIATDIAGNVSSASASLAVTIDLLPPSPGVVNDGAGPDIDNQQTATISANWSGFTDSTGVVSYDWAVGTSPGATDIMAFTSVGTATSASASGLPVSPAVLYYVTVRAHDAAGSTTSSSSDGVIIDNIPPNAPDSLGQHRTDGAGIMTGGTTNEAVVEFRAQLSDSDTGQPLHLEVEVQPVGVAFTGTPTAVGDARPAGPNSVLVTGLAPGNYHWQVRTVDSIGSSSSYQVYGANADPGDTDFTVSIPANAPPGNPTSLGQFGATGASPIGVGGTTGESTVVFKAAGSDPDGDNLRLEIEILPTGTPFTGTPTDVGSFVSSGAALEATATGLANGAYHWQARLADAAGGSSSWVVFGGNADPGDPDVIVDTSTNTPPADPAPTQHADTGLLSVPAGWVDTDGRLAFRAALSDVDGSQSLQLEVELRPTSVPFDNVPTVVSGWIGGSATAEVVVEGLPNGNYHWQARARDSAGGVSAWVSFGGNLETDTDFTVSLLPGTPVLGSLEQFHADAATPLLEGGATTQGGVVFRATLTDPDGDAIRLQIEVCTTAQFFTSIMTAESGLVPSGGTASILVTGLADGTYQWRARAVSALGAASPWSSFGVAPDGATDFVINTAGNTSPALLALDQTTLLGASLVVGAGTTEGSIRMQGTVTEADAGQTVRLVVEIKPVGIAFDGTPSGTSSFVLSGSVAEVIVAGLTNGTSYHWQAWAEDSAGGFSAATPFGGNADPGATDFQKLASAGAPPVPTELAQLLINGSLDIPLGATTNETGARFTARVIDLDGGAMQIEVEIQPVGTPFAGVPSAAGSFVASGNVARVTISGLANLIGFHWQVRSVNSSGLSSAWVTFGGNLESEADFLVDVASAGIREPQAPPRATGGFCGSVGIDLLLPVGVLWLLSRRRRGKK